MNTSSNSKLRAYLDSRPLHIAGKIPLKGMTSLSAPSSQDRMDTIALLRDLLAEIQKLPGMNDNQKTLLKEIVAKVNELIAEEHPIALSALENPELIISQDEMNRRLGISEERFRKYNP